MPIPYYPHSGRKNHYWKLRKDGLRDLLIKKRWGLRGAYAEKIIHGQTIKMIEVKETDEYLLYCFLRSDDFWANITKQAREQEAKKTRQAFHVVPSTANTSDNTKSS